MDIRVKFLDYSFIQVECEDQSLYYTLREQYSFMSDNYMFDPRFKYGAWDGKIRLFKPDGTLPFGLLDNLVKFCNNMGYKIDVDPKCYNKTEITMAEFESWLDKQEFWSQDSSTKEWTQITPYWYQKQAAYEGILNRRRILNLPTSAGKSLIQYIIAKWYLEHYTGKVLIIVPTQTLVKQMIADFREYSKNELPEYAFLGIMSGSKKNSDAPIYVSTWQSAVKMIPDWFEQFGLLQNDECHLATGKSINAIIERSIHTPFKIGLSGSLRDGKANMMVYVGMFGGVYKPVETHELMEDGQVTKLQINCLFVEYSDEEKKQIAYFKENENGRLVHAEYQDEITFINNHIHRNLMVCKLAAKLASGDENVFVMFRFEEHGKLLEKILKRIYDNDKIVFLNGTVSLEERDKAKIEAETRKGVIYIASYGTFSTGVSIKNLHHVIFAHPTKAKTTVLQSIGRVLRKHKSKAIATLWDIIDDIALRNTNPKAKSKYKYINYALDHAAQRIERYGQEKFDYTIRKVVLKY